MSFKNTINLNLPDPPGEMSSTRVQKEVFALTNLEEKNKCGIISVSNVTYLSFMFHQSSLFNININNWDVSNITMME